MSLAENTLQTSNQRLFASSDGAFYELVLGAGSWRRLTVPVLFKDGRTRRCYFLGITESAGMVYTACTENALNPLAKKYLLALDMYQPAVRLQEVGELRDMALPNGLAADSSGNLYIADSGMPFLPGTIQKVTLAAPFAIATQTVLHHFAAYKPNGLRYASGKLYVTVNPFSYVGMSQLLRYDLGTNGLSNPAPIYSSLAFLDDFALVDSGAVVSEFLAGRIVHVDERGSELHHAVFSQPTSVSLLTAATYGAGNLLVTERNRGSVHRFINNWGLRPR
ncbi:hypothetical protein GCM10027343_14150 [Noviherbaspirillum agri]